VLSRDIVVQNSLGTGALVNFAAGQKDIYLTGPAPLRAGLAKSANYTLTLGDHGRTLDGTGTWTLSLPAAATLGDGFFFKLRNSGAGTITLDPNGAETIDGAATITAGPGEGFHVECDGAAFKTIGRAAASTLPRGHLSGLTLSNNVTDATNDIDITEGKARADDDAADIVLPSGITKRLDAAWAVGTNQGGLDTGTISNITYHVWLIERSDTGVVDVLFSASASAPTMPSNYDKKRRLGSILRIAGAILPFTQYADNFRLKTAVLDYSQNAPGTSAITLQLNRVPSGLPVMAHLFGQAENDTSVQAILLTALTDTDQTPTTATGLSQSGSSSASDGMFGEVFVPTDASAQIRARVANSSANADIRIWTRGWIDRRGRDG
jgi:hypothetical protein